MRARALAAVAITFVLATALYALDVPPAPAQWVTDKAGILQPDQLNSLNQKLSDFEQQSGAQFIIYVFPSLEGEPIEDFTIRCVEKWKVGQKKYDNGLVLFVFVKDRKIRIEVGYGLEGSVTDAYSSRVIRDYIAPHFQQGDWYGGLNAAADALIAKIRGGEPPVPPLNPRGAAQPSGGDNGGGFGAIIPILILFVLLFFILPLLVRGGGCGGCFWPMLFMGGGRGGGMTFGGGGGFGGGFGGGGGFSGGGGSFGGGGATGGW